MEGPIRKIEIIRVNSADEPLAAEDELLSERAVSLYIDGRYDGSAVISAGGEELWAAGNMRCRGLISSYGDIEKSRPADAGWRSLSKEGRPRPISGR